jgi:hypothetical protein
MFDNQISSSKSYRAYFRLRLFGLAGLFLCHKLERGSKMEGQAAKEKYRVQLDFTEEAFAELTALQQKLNASSRAEVVRNALGVLKWVTNNLTEGNKVFVERRDGTRAEVEFPFLLVG